MNALVIPLLKSFQREEEHETNESEINRIVELVLRDLKEGKDHGFLAFLEGELVGFQIVHKYLNQADGFRGVGTLEFTSSYVKQPSRCQGIGRRMKELCIEQALEDKDISALLAVIDEENSPSINLHQQLGFKRIDEYCDGVSRTYIVYQRDTA